MAGITIPNSQEIPFSVQGYITDPKQVGYQILTNYESTYWAPLVGNDAWRLYEVLRSFCHQGCTTCYPSINLLLAILGLKDRSVLIGRAKPKTVKGKSYSYPGLIQTLQEHNLVIAEVLGDGPTLRYTFHVNLTPALLTDEQLGKLPQLLQDKHRELLERCEAERKALEAKKKPPKLPVQQEAPEPPQETEGGIGISNTPLGNSNTPSWNFQYKQHPINTTHKTTSAAREDHNNNSSAAHAPSPDVVVALTSQGIAEKVAKRLAGHYSKERIAEKIAYLTFLQSEDPDKVQNPRGWLRRAIEEDYGPPDGFVTAEEQTRRAASAAEEAQRAEVIEQGHRAFAAQVQARREDRRRQLQAQYGTSEEAYQLWAEVLTFAKYGQPDLYDLYNRAQILRCTEEVVLLGFEHEGILRKLDHPGTMAALKRHLKLIAKRPLEVERVLLPVAVMGDAGEDEAEATPS